MRKASTACGVCRCRPDNSNDASCSIYGDGFGPRNFMYEAQQDNGQTYRGFAYALQLQVARVLGRGEIVPRLTIRAR